MLCLVTDRRRLAGAGSSIDEATSCLERQTRFAAEAGVDLVQVRERDLEAAVLASLVREGVVTPAVLPYRREGETGVLRYLERACPDYLIVFPAWFPTLSEMTDRFRPVYRVRLDHNTVAGADELVVYETIWSRWRADRRPCPGALAGSPAPGGPVPAGKGRDRIIGSWSP